MPENCTQKLVNVESAWDTDIVCEKVKELSYKINEAEVEKAVRKMKGNVAHPTGVKYLKLQEGTEFSDSQI